MSKFKANIKIKLKGLKLYINDKLQMNKLDSIEENYLFYYTCVWWKNQVSPQRLMNKSSVNAISVTY